MTRRMRQARRPRRGNRKCSRTSVRTRETASEATPSWQGARHSPPTSSGSGAAQDVRRMFAQDAPYYSAGRLTGQRDPPVVLRMPIHPRPPKFYINQRTCTLSRTQAKRRGRCRRHPSSLLQMQGQEPLACTWTPSSLPATVALARAAARKTSPYVSSSASHTSLAGSRDARASNRLPSAWTQARCSL